MGIGRQTFYLFHCLPMIPVLLAAVSYSLLESTRAQIANVTTTGLREMEVTNVTKESETFLTINRSM